MYVAPQTLIFQEILTASARVVRDRPAHISGPNAQLLRYADEDEKELGALGSYDRLNATSYLWPDRPAGGKVDESYTQVHIENALLRYFSDTIGSGDTITTVAGEVNKIKAATTNFRANGSTYPLAAALINREVRVGDTALIRAVVGSDTYELCTYVAGLEAEKVAAAVQSAVAGSANQATTTAAVSGVSQLAGPTNCVVITGTSGTNYDGRDEGNVSETYTITVIQDSTGENATTARLRVKSASGNDDVNVVQPAAFGSPTAIGTRGLTVTWGNANGEACSLSAAEEGYDHNDFLVGQTWTVTVRQAYTAVSATSGGTYTGLTDDTYVVEVTRGGAYSTDVSVAPLITVRTTRGQDVSGPHPVKGTGAIAVGSKGVTVAFNQTALVAGDRFHIPVTASKAGAYRTIVLGHNLPDEVIDNGATAVDLHLYIRKDIVVNPNRVESPPQTNYTQSDTELTLAAGITAYDSSWTDANGDELPLPVHAEATYGQVYVTVRYWLSDLCREVNGISDVSQLDAIPGPLHPDNPLKWGVYSALSNSNGRLVTYTSVCDPDDLDSWQDVLEVIDGRSDVYGVVPLTHNKDVWNLYHAHVNAQSSPEAASWRVLWLNAVGIDEIAVVDASTSSDEEVVLATISDDPNTSGSQYTYVRVPAGNGQFVTNDVAPGDIVRALFSTDGFGGVTWQEFVIDDVINEDTLRLLTGPSSPVTVAEKIEIWRSLTNTEEAEEHAKTYGFSDKRVMMVWPDEFVDGGFTVPGYMLCAKLAGLRSGVAPHQGLTRVAIAGVQNVDRTVKKFNATQLNRMAGGGVWIVTQDAETGAVYSRHAVSTAPYENTAEREEMVTSNFDSVSRFFMDTYEPYIGKSNVTPSALSILRAETRASIKALESTNFIPRIGPQLISGEIVELRPHATLLDRVVIVVDLTMPFPLNNIEGHLRLVA